MSDEKSLVTMSDEQLFARCEKAAKSGLVPPSLKGNANGLFMVAQLGYELGVSPMQCMLSMHLIKNKPAMPGVMYAGVIQADPRCIAYDVAFGGTGEEFGCTITTQRKGHPGQASTKFTIEDAKQARLTGSENWQKYLKDMLFNKAVARHGKRFWADRLMGIQVVEDMPVDVGPSRALPADTGEPDPAMALLKRPEPAQAEPLSGEDSDPLVPEIVDPEPSSAARSDDEPPPIGENGADGVRDERLAGGFGPSLANTNVLGPQVPLEEGVQETPEVTQISELDANSVKAAIQRRAAKFADEDDAVLNLQMQTMTMFEIQRASEMTPEQLKHFNRWVVNAKLKK
jgi:hypothetical protein